jgi:hypothetical protein
MPSTLDRRLRSLEGTELVLVGLQHLKHSLDRERLGQRVHANNVAFLADSESLLVAAPLFPVLALHLRRDEHRSTVVGVSGSLAGGHPNVGDHALHGSGLRPGSTSWQSRGHPAREARADRRRWSPPMQPSGSHRSGRLRSCCRLSWRCRLPGCPDRPRPRG